MGSEKITGILLAGGQGRRMGGVDKGLQLLRGKPMAQHVIERFAPQVDELLINANKNIKQYQALGYRVIPDAIGGFVGPLAGPKLLPDHRVVVVTDDGILNEICALGGPNIVGAGIRVGVKSDGTVSYMNPDYWYRAFFRGQFPKAEKSVRAVQEKLVRTLGAGQGFGGDMPAVELPRYRYILGMERFDSEKNKLAEHVSFDQAVKTIRDNLDKGVARTSKVYEVVLPNEKIAVFGVAMNDPTTGDGSWVLRIGGQQSVATLPYELYVVNNTANALYGRYRIALSYPELNMAHFMRIVGTPEEIRQTMATVAGAKAK